MKKKFFFKGYFNYEKKIFFFKVDFLFTMKKKNFFSRGLILFIKVGFTIHIIFEFFKCF